ncbi:MAG: molybdenum cofactor biosynthesis protein MoaE [Solirubrobacterales bacterium]|nr:molybdenum cofactor biosynthesis protein MoaE [Solirubrobacterales bacterium]
MRLQVRLFAGLREAAGADSIEVEVGDDPTAAGLLDEMRDQTELGKLLQRMPVRVAVNSSYVAGETVLEAGDEIALVPPISGGSQIRATVTNETIDIAAISKEAGDPAAGAVVVFQGVTREVARLEYEAYVEMAEQRMGEILIDCVERFGLTGAVAEHRTGEVPLGEPSVVVAVSAPHRPEAFDGAREAIDRIKAEAPVWKVEVTADGVSHRVEGSLPDVDHEVVG